MVSNARGGVQISRKSVTMVYGSTLLALRGGWVDVKCPGKQRYITLEWPLNQVHVNLSIII